MQSPPKPTRTVKLTGFIGSCPPVPALIADLRPSSAGIASNVLLAGGDSNSCCQQVEACEPVTNIVSPFNCSLTSQATTLSAMDYDGPSLEAVLVDRVLDNVLSLPAVVEDVASKNRQFTCELEHQKEQLRISQEKLKRAHDCIARIKEELSNVRRKIYLTEDSTAEKSRCCITVQSEIDKLFSECSCYEAECEKQNAELNRLSEVHSVYRAKMKQHVEFVESVNSFSVYHSQRQQLDYKLQQLQQQKAAVTQSQTPDHLLVVVESNVDDMRLDEDILFLTAEIQNYQEKRRTIKQDIKVLNKRNMAQLTRLKHQLKEAQHRRQQSTDDTECLDVSVAALTSQLHENLD